MSRTILVTACVVAVLIFFQYTVDGQHQVNLQRNLKRSAPPMAAPSIRYGTNTRLLPSESRHLVRQSGLLPSEHQYQRRMTGSLPSSGLATHLQQPSIRYNTGIHRRYTSSYASATSSRPAKAYHLAPTLRYGTTPRPTMPSPPPSATGHIIRQKNTLPIVKSSALSKPPYLTGTIRYGYK